MYTRPPMGVAPPPSVGVEEKSPGYLCFKDYIDRHSEAVPSRCIRTLNLFSTVSVPKPGFHWEDCEERTKKKLLKNNDDSMHPYKAIVV